MGRRQQTARIATGNRRLTQSPESHTSIPASTTVALGRARFVDSAEMPTLSLDSEQKTSSTHHHNISDPTVSRSPKKLSKYYDDGDFRNGLNTGSITEEEGKQTSALEGTEGQDMDVEVGDKSKARMGQGAYASDLTLVP